MPAGAKLINLMGSHGTKAVAAAALGTQATCVDVSPVNAAYCAQMAAAAGVHVEFVVANVLHMPDDLLTGEQHSVSTPSQQSKQPAWHGRPAHQATACGSTSTSTPAKPPLRGGAVRSHRSPVDLLRQTQFMVSLSDIRLAPSHLLKPA